MSGINNIEAAILGVLIYVGILIIREKLERD